jgi:hypothetical protein
MSVSVAMTRLVVRGLQDPLSAVDHQYSMNGSIARLTSSMRGPVAPLQLAHGSVPVPSGLYNLTSQRIPFVEFADASANGRMTREHKSVVPL